MFKNDLAYREKAKVNWCPNCKTVIADEQVIGGKCERCKNEVKQREMSSWYFAITKYADKLLDNIEKINWPERIKVAQRNWIGRSEGAEVEFPIHNSKSKIKVFTTRPDTLYGVTFFVLSPENKYVEQITISNHKSMVREYVNKAKAKTKEERIAGDRDKKGVFTGGYVINPANKKKIPVYVAEYVLMDYGTGAVMGVPAHDERDWEFARENELPIDEVISGGDVNEKAFDEPGEVVNSGDWNGIKVPENLDKVLTDLEGKGWGKKARSYHLRDWLISRQRYWGPPIPLIFCKDCEEKGKGEKKDMPGWYTVSEKDLPVILPDIKEYKPKGDGTSPLSNAPESWREVDCPDCGSKARRELDVSDTFLDSSWYFLRYPSVENTEKAWGKKEVERWLPVNAYIGGAEHAVLHLLYSRFVTMAFADWGLLSFEEPFPFLYGHGLLIKDGSKMSKSRGNVVVPDDYIAKYGADTLRLYLMFIGPFDRGGDFRDTGIEGMRRFTEKVWGLYQVSDSQIKIANEDDLLRKMHQTIKKVTEDIDKFHYNTAISAIMEYVNTLKAQVSDGKTENKDNKEAPEVWKEALRILALLVAPFAPHLAEEVWVEKLGEKFTIHKSPWPAYDAKYIKVEHVEIVVQVNGRLRSTIVFNLEEAKDKKKVLLKVKEDEKIKKWIEGKKIKKEIFVPEKLVNIVV
jgi:leucyl-tRNA synthetase